MSARGLASLGCGANVQRGNRESEGVAINRVDRTLQLAHVRPIASGT